MSDTLCTRIAKVLHERFGPSLGAHPDGWDREPGGTRDMYLADADAVIAELGGIEEWSVEVDYYGNVIRDLFDNREAAETRRGEIEADDPHARAWLVRRWLTDWTRDE